jgi:DNA-binding LytR/AlgR family response regulator
MTFRNINLHPSELDVVLQVIKSDIYNDILSADVSLIYLRSLTSQERLLLRQTINRNPDSSIIVLSENPLVAKFSWKINAFHFLDYPLKESELKNLKVKLIQRLNERRDLEKLKMSFKGGFDLLHPEDICVVKGEGNYCKFYFRNDKPKIYTGRIGSINSKLLDFPYMIRVNNSLIININHLAQITKNDAIFTGSPKVTIKLSDNSVRSIKKQLFWTED